MRALLGVAPVAGSPTAAARFEDLLAINSATPLTNGWYAPSVNVLGVTTNGVGRGGISANGNWSLSASVTTSAVGAYALTVQAPATSGSSYGLLITAGTTVADLALQVLNAAINADLFVVYGNGAIGLPSVATTTTAPATGTAGALPAKPTGYFSVTIAGYAAKVPYY